MCACRCGIRVHLRGGEVRYIDGNPGHPLNQGVICAKGSSGIMKQYSPARLTKPLARKPGSARGDNQFVDQISEVVYGAADEKKGYTTTGSQILHPKTMVRSGTLASECAEIMKRFFRKKRD